MENHEIELKFEVNYFEITKKLRERFNFVSSAYELTTMYDNKDQDLFKRDARLRLRFIRDVVNQKEKAELSYKKPISREGIKIEEEIETSLTNYKAMQTLLSEMGFFEVSSYERIRDTYEHKGVKITVDTFPFGDYLEIEGELINIRSIAIELGLDLESNIPESCDDIYVRLCNERRVKPSEHIRFGVLELERRIDERKIYFSK